MEHTLETEKMTALGMASLYDERAWTMFEFQNWDMEREYSAKMHMWLRIYEALTTIK